LKIIVSRPRRAERSNQHLESDGDAPGKLPHIFDGLADW
jgi:hypothetical protein